MLMIAKSITPRLDILSDELNFRDYEFEELLTSFRRVLTNPGEAIARVILIGPPGSGKSFVLHNFQNKIQMKRIINRETDVQLKCLTVDCGKYNSSKEVVMAIIQQIDPYFYANLDECFTAELQYILADILLAKKETLIVIFDNIDSLVTKEPEEVNSLLYGFQRFSEGKTKDEPNLFSQILVAQDLEFLTELDRTVFRKISTDVIPFEAYSSEQTVQLLNEHIKKKVKRKITEETVWFISMIARGNMHLAFELLTEGEALAQREQSITIHPEHIRSINKRITDFQITEQKVEEFTLGTKLMLLTIARKFKANTKAFLNFLDLPCLYISICEEYDQMQQAKYFSEILGDLEKMCIVSLHYVEREIFVTLSDISATELSCYLEKSVKQKRRDKPYFL